MELATLGDNVAATMTSVELVDFINAERQSDGKKALAHSDFLKKVPLVLKDGAGKFSSTYIDSQNKARPCYRLPKREACLMAMSYSYELQARVFDRMTALEQAASLAVMQDTIERLKENLAVIEARTQPENKHFTVLGFANLKGKPLDIKTASKLGRVCAEISRKQGLVIGDVSDPRFGTVHTYHESVLEAVLAQVGIA